MTTYKTRFEWHKAVNRTITSVLERCYPRDWDEDYITRSILFELRKYHSYVVIEKEKPYSADSKIFWDVCKNTLKNGIENKHGDIGLLVQLRFEKDKILEGVAFLEAKRIDYNHSTKTPKFKSLDMKQLKRYCNNSSFHRTVFYDFDVTHKQAYALTLPTRHLLVIKRNDRSLYAHCEYLSYCITNRYLRGYELDFDSTLVKTIKGFLNKNGGVRYLIIAQCCMNPQLEIAPDLIKFNRNIYKSMEKTDKI